jgi:predicted N-acetyltransferase YhbS
MSIDLTIRPELDRDDVATGNIIRAAFSGMPYADGDEAELVEALRRENALSVSLVAELAGTVIGQIAFSPAMASDGTPGWYALGPVAVLPAYQGAGVGSALVRAGLQAITELGAYGCILVGNPAYYVRFGFELSPWNAPAGEPAEFFMVKLFGQRQPQGPVSFHAAFSSTV